MTAVSNNLFMLVSLLDFHSIANLGRMKLPGEFPREPGRGGEAGAVAGADLLDAVRPERPDGLVELGLAAQAEMGAPDDRMDLCHAGLAPGVLDGVDQPGMAAAEDQDEPLRRPDHQRLVVRQGVGRAAAVVAAKPRVTLFKRGVPRDLTGQADAGCDLPEPLVEAEAPAYAAQEGLVVRDADGSAVAGILHPVAPGKERRMGEDLLAAAGAKKRQQPTGVVVMAVGEGYACQPVEVPVHPQGIVQEGVPLSRVEQEASPLPLHQCGEAVFAERSRQRADRIVAEDSDAVVHGVLLGRGGSCARSVAGQPQGLPLPLHYFVSHSSGSFGTPSFARMVIIGHQLVKPDWKRFSPTKPVNQSQFML